MEKKKKSNSPTQEIPNIYEITNKKPLNKKRHVATGDGKYKSKDEKRRTHAINRKKRRRIIRVSIFTFFVFAILFSLVLALSQVFCRVDTITVKYSDKADNSKRYYTNEQIISASTVSKGKNIVFISTSKAGEKIETLLPYISDATVKKDFPSGVVIEIKECKNIYAFSADVGFVLADESGKYLETADEKKASAYPILSVDTVKTEAVGESITLIDGKDTDSTAEILEYLKLVRKSGIKITGADFKNMSDVYLKYDGRINIHIGKMSDEKNGVTAWKKLQLAKKSLEAEDKQNPEQRGTLNMTIAKKAYFKAESELPEEEKSEN